MDSLIYDILIKEFRKRKNQDRTYSVRAYARALEIDNSVLSKILRGKRRISGMTMQHLASKLGLQLVTIERQKLAEIAQTLEPDMHSERRSMNDAVTVCVSVKK